MYIFVLISLIIGYIFIFCVGVYTFIHIIYHYENFGAKLTAILNFLTIFVAIIIYSTCSLLSITIFFSEKINLTLWKLSVIFLSLDFILTSVIYSFLKVYKRLPYFPFTFLTIIFGLLIGLLFSPNSVQIFLHHSNTPPFFIIDISNINYSFNFITGITISIFQCCIAAHIITQSILIYLNTLNKKIVKGLSITTIIILFPILMYILYIVSQNPIFRELHFLSLWIVIFGLCYILIKKPEMFLELTNKIYSINIYHKSGILLYSYKFGKINNESDSTIWGNILIGINHILSEFVDPKEKIDVLQTDSSNIIVNYDELGFAVVLITNRKNAILKKLLDNFTIVFKNKYKNELMEIQDLNRLINVSEFKETRDIIEKSFQIYL
ncbi:MAG: hypothetical protein ACFFBK_14040 [Promethearchaeota archaeon]